MKPMQNNELTQNPVSSRRHFILGFILSAGALSLGLGSAVSQTARFIFNGLLGGEKFKAGKPEDFKIGQVDARWKEKYGVWIVRSFDGLFALSAASAFGCKPQWLEKEQRFYCKCHDKSYYKSGISFQGAAGKSLERFKVTRAQDGEMLVDTGRIFRLEKNQWQNPLSILSV